MPDEEMEEFMNRTPDVAFTGDSVECPVCGFKMTLQATWDMAGWQTACRCGTKYERVGM